MRIFVTGATGFVGHAVSAELARAGHTVFGLARSEAKATRLAAAEVLPVIGDMASPDSYLEAARSAQVLIHCAAEYSAHYMELDRRTVTALLDAARDAQRPRLVIYTSGCWIYGETGPEPVDESAAPHPAAMVAPRLDTEALILERASGDVRCIILRPGSAYGGAGSLTGSWFFSAGKEGAARMVGDGNFHWPMVHIGDLAAAYRLAAESHFNRQVFNVADRSRCTVRECAEAAARVVTGSTKVIATRVEDAAKMMGPIAECLTLDQHVDSSKAMRLLNWNPRHGGFVDGVKRYYESWKAFR